MYIHMIYTRTTSHTSHDRPPATPPLLLFFKPSTIMHISLRCSLLIKIIIRSSGGDPFPTPLSLFIRKKGSHLYPVSKFPPCKKFPSVKIPRKKISKNYNYRKKNFFLFFYFFYFLLSKKVNNTMLVCKWLKPREYYPNQHSIIK